MRILALVFLCLLSPLAAAKDDPPVPALPLPAGTPGAMVMVWKNRFVEAIPDPNPENTRHADPGGYLFYKMAKDAEARAVFMRDAVAPSKLGDYYPQVIRDHMGGLAQPDTLTVVDMPWTAEEAYERTRQSDGLYYELWPSFGMQLKMQGIGAWLHVDLMRVEKGKGGKPEIKTLRTYSMSFCNVFETFRNAPDSQMARIWMAMSPEDLVARLRDSMDQVGAMLEYQVSPEGVAEWERKIKGERFPYHGHEVPVRGVRQGEGWYWVRSNNRAYKWKWLQGERLIPDDHLPPPVPADDPRLMDASKR